MGNPVWTTRDRTIHVEICQITCAENLRKLCTHFDSNSAEKYEAIPYEVMQYLPFDEQTISNVEGNASRLGDPESAHDFENLLEEAPRRFVFRGMENALSGRRWEAVLNRWPKLAISRILAPWRGEEETDLEEDQLKKVVTTILSEPDLLTTVDFFYWGKLLSAAPECETGLRELILSAAASVNTSFQWRYRRHMEIFPFAISLPVEASLIPSLVSSAMHWSFYSREPRFHHFERNQQPQFDGAGQLVEAYLPDPTTIMAIDVNKRDPTLLDGYLVLLRMIHPATNAPVDSGSDVICSVYSDTGDEVFLRNIIFFVCLEKSESDTDAADLVSQLLDLSRERIDHREMFHTLLNLWREDSKSPATRAKAVETWL